MSTTRPPKRWAQSKDWDTALPEIQKLYTEEKKTLKEVMVIMEQEHQFYATPRMYKAKLKAYGISKNLKAREAVALLYSMEERQAAGERSQVVVRGQPHDLEWLKSYVKRNRNRGRFAKMNLGEIQNTTNKVTTTALVIHSGSTAPTAPLESPEPLLSTETLFRSISVYVDGAFASGDWFTHQDGLLRSSRSDPSHHGPILMDFWNRIDLASQLMVKSDRVDLVGLLDPAFANMINVVRDEYPRTIPFFLSCFEVIRGRGCADLIKTFLRYLSSLSCNVLGDQHPQTRIWAQVAATFANAANSGGGVGTPHDDVLERTFLLLLDRHGAQAERSAAFEIAVYNDYVDAVLSQRDLETQERSLRRQVGIVESMGEAATNSFQANLLLLRHASAVKDLRMQQGRYAEAEVAMDVLRDHGDWDGAHGVKARAEARLAMGDLPAAERFFREASGLIDSNPTFKDEVWVNDVLESFEKVLVLNGKLEEAAQASKTRLDRIEGLSAEELTL